MARPISRYRILAVCCVVALASLVPTRSYAQPNEARRVAQQARGLALGGQCEQAIPSFDRAIQLNPAWPDLLRDRGACHELLGHREAAAADYRAYCDASPTAADVPALRQRIVALQAPAQRQAPAPVVPVFVPPPSSAAPPPAPLPTAPSAGPYTLDSEYPVTAPADSAETPDGRSSRSGRRVRRISDEPEADRAPNSIFVEGLGAGLLYSINYERLVIDDLAVRVGFSYLPLSAGGISTSTLFFPITASYIGVHSGKHALELGGGVTVVYASGTVSGLGYSASGSGAAPLGLVMAGYRLHPVNGAGFQFRAGLMAIIGEGVTFSGSAQPSLGVIPWPYVSLGGSF